VRLKPRQRYPHERDGAVVCTTGAYLGHHTRVQPTGISPSHSNLIILRFIEVISRMAANPDAAIFLPREAFQTLEGVRALLQSGEQDMKRKLEAKKPE